MPYTAISALPTAPERTQAQATFSTNTDAFLTALPALVTQVNAAGDFIETSETASAASASAALSSAAQAAASESAAALAALSSSGYVGEWSAQSGAFIAGASVSHGGVVWLLSVDLANVAVNEPGITTDWIAIGGENWQALKTASFTAYAGLSYQIEAIGSAVDVTLPVTLTDGSAYTVHNSSASTSTVRVLNALYTIRGASGSLTSGNNLILEAGDTAKLIAKGTLILEVV